MDFFRYIAEQFRKRHAVFSASLRLDWQIGKHMCGGPATVIPLHFKLTLPTSNSYQRDFEGMAKALAKGSGVSPDSYFIDGNYQEDITTKKNWKDTVLYFHGGVPGSTVSNDFAAMGHPGDRLAEYKEWYNGATTQIKSRWFDTQDSWKIGLNNYFGQFKQPYVQPESVCPRPTYEHCKKCTVTTGCCDVCEATNKVADAQLKSTFADEDDEDGMAAVSRLPPLPAWTVRGRSLGSRGSASQFADAALSLEWKAQQYMPFLDEILRRRSEGDNRGSKLATILNDIDAIYKQPRHTASALTLQKRATILYERFGPALQRSGTLSLALPPQLSVGSIICLSVGATQDQGLDFNVGFNGDMRDCNAYIQKNLIEAKQEGLLASPLAWLGCVVAHFYQTCLVIFSQN